MNAYLIASTSLLLHQLQFTSLSFCSLFPAVFEVNVFGLVATTQAFLPLLRASKGRVINISSIAGLLAMGAHSAYASSKFAVEGFSDSLRKELRPLGVAVSLVNPAYVQSKIFDKSLSQLQHLDMANQEWVQLYGRYFQDAEARTAKTLQQVYY